MFEVIDPGNFAIFSELNTFTLAVFVVSEIARSYAINSLESGGNICYLNCHNRETVSDKMSSASSDGGSFDEVKDLLTCLLCSKTLNEPRSLPCFHNFCKVCLGEYNSFI